MGLTEPHSLITRFSVISAPSTRVGSSALLNAERSDGSIALEEPTSSERMKMKSHFGTWNLGARNVVRGVLNGGLGTKNSAPGTKRGEGAPPSRRRQTPRAGLPVTPLGGATLAHKNVFGPELSR